MASITFYLDKVKRDKQGRSFIFFDIKAPGLRIRRTTEKKVVEEQWDSNSEKVRKPKSKKPDNNYLKINSTIDEIRSNVNKIFIEAELLDVNLTKQFVNERLKENKRDLQKTNNTIYFFLDTFKRFVESQTPIKAKNTLRNYRNLHNVIEKYSGYRDIILSLEDFSLEWFEDFRKYCYEIKERPTSDNYFRKHISVLKTFMDWAVERGLTKNLVYKRFQAPERETNIICLQKEELLKLFNHPFTSMDLSIVRDIYCFACFTGLRISDIESLKKEHIIGDAIQKDIYKSRKIDVIPLIKHAQKIINRYNDYPSNSALPKVSKFNKLIKSAAMQAGLDRKVSTFIFTGGKANYQTRPLHDVISAHTARKTFITTSLELGMPRDKVKAISGHKKDANFDRYYKFAEQSKKEAINDAWNKF